jgi:hypothetical protein
MQDTDENGTIDADEYRSMFRRLYKAVAGDDDLEDIDVLCAEVVQKSCPLSPCFRPSSPPSLRVPLP